MAPCTSDRYSLPNELNLVFLHKLNKHERQDWSHRMVGEVTTLK